VKELLPPAYTVKERGKVTVKGKGEMITYWVESKANRIPPTLAEVTMRIQLIKWTVACDFLKFQSSSRKQKDPDFCPCFT